MNIDADRPGHPVVIRLDFTQTSMPPGERFTNTLGGVRSLKFLARQQRCCVSQWICGG
jgi:hypothetical protein